MNAASNTPELASGLFQAVVKHAADAMIYSDREGIIRIWNDRAMQVFGHTSAEALNRNLDLIIPKELREAHWRGFSRAMANGYTASVTKHLVTPALHKSGGTLYVELGFSVVSDESARVIGSMAVVRDITQRFLAEDAVLKEELNLHAKRPGWSWL